MTSAQAKKNQLKIELIRDLDAAYAQLKLYRENKGDGELPEALKNRLDYLRAYSACILEMEKRDKQGSVESLAKRLQHIYIGDKS